MRQRSSGFTLLEVVVALVVAGVAVAIGYAGLATVSEASARSRASSQPVIAAAAVRSALSAWLSSATLMEGTHPFRGVHRTDGPTRSDELTTGVHGHARESAIRHRAGSAIPGAGRREKTLGR